ncbi:tRNA 2-methylthioadenosine synthase [Giardia muris]|uniref:Threonylcarbamoyladenosine tRNA methylthiotransferase n=1 Tax=Giardia muris TaxID=5742 RepID=A0A4Z1T6J9_GIAMU|nr:tRNA 2-methylthioadenosine synthase [Giardia muris]|eukprot:TNJ29693.1 tRNA 2-methylthioadenosine synthase [Giardia muris]
MDLEDCIPARLSPSQLSSALEGVSVHVYSMGCGHNQADGDLILTTLCSAGAIIRPKSSADVIYINSCTVKNPSEDKALEMARSAFRRAQLVILGGCVPQSKRTLPDDLEERVREGRLIITGTLTMTWLETLPDLIRQMLMEKENGFEKKEEGKRYIDPQAVRSNEERMLVCTPKYRLNPLVDIIPIGTGCMGACTYCKTIQSRGRLRSASIEVLEQRIRDGLTSSEVRELWLTGEDTLAWGRDQSETFVTLFDTLLPLFKGTVKMLRIGMTDPESVIGYEAGLIRILKHPNVYKFLHLPVQSGSDAILSGMNRKYTAQSYMETCQRLLKEVPDLCISTDIICGFPGETDEDHALTLSLFEREDLHFEVVNVTQYYARLNTPAARLPQIPAAVKKRRTREMADVAIKAFHREKYVGQIHDILVSERLSIGRNGKTFGGKTYSNISIGIEDPPTDSGISLEIGQYLRVQVTDGTRVALSAKVLALHPQPVLVRRIK